MLKATINFTKANGLVPAVVQDDQTKDIFMLGYMNEEALEKTIETGWVHFWSRSRKELWMKGSQSGNKLKVVDILLDCDQDTVLIKAELIGNHACHTGNRTCFFERLEKT